jgi:predicted RNase H-like HicB family nuclease
MRHVYALIHEANGSFGISFPDFPGCVAAGRSQDEAVAQGRAALASHVEGMVEDGEPMPLLRSQAELTADPAFVEGAVGATLALVPIDPPTHMVRITVRIDETLLNQVDRAARSRGVSRSSFIVAALQAQLAG